MNSEQIYDVTIIGGGPAGLFSAFYSGLREMKTKIIEYQPFLGGKVHVYPEKLIWDVGGMTPVTGAKLIEQMVQQGQTFDPQVVLGQKVTSIEKDDQDLFLIETTSGEKHISKTVILAVGGGIINPSKLDLEGASRFEVSNLNYTVTSLSKFQDKTVLISGGGNVAIDWANELEPIAKKVYLTYRNEALKGHEAEVKKLENSTVDLLLETSIHKLIAGEDHNQITNVQLKNNDDGSTFDIEVDEVIINHGYERDTELLSQSGVNVKLTEEGRVAASPTCETSVPGLFAAGDIVDHEGKFKLIAGAFQEAGNAVNKAKLYLDPDATIRGRVSSHNDLFKEKNRELIKHLYKSPS
ncbi:NAD(P)/FAD-dependent oxidoreductase [Saliterribacillus persicus]|uniref:Ferredoxin--NADP reductase n=1 Tax=Saliterribacillus persicus TaxID=930114 RepID=A0A368YDM0_9BACI|nr:NAD(P)/FAD-dependent oxidoreductase [Saliterribacillus persicus]RCW76977.1 thioredoxin reductase (NADPH) [Saliterribacillus persicus]